MNQPADPSSDNSESVFGDSMTYSDYLTSNMIEHVSGHF